MGKRAGRLRRYLGWIVSFIIYYGIPFRLYKMRRLYRQFIEPGSLCFDLGSHLGNRIRAWRKLGASVVAIEPSPACHSFLTKRYGRDDRIHILQQAVGAKAGRAVLYVCESSPTLSTLSVSWMERIKSVYGSDTISWKRGTEVDVVTLDELIREYGLPTFVKIDVEGFEAEVLKGLSQPVPALSFEFLPAAITPAVEAAERLVSIGPYEFNISSVETMRMVWNRWAGIETLTSYLTSLPAHGRSGDVYCRLPTTENG